MRNCIFFDFFGVIGSEIAPVFFKRFYDKETAIAMKEKIFQRADRGEISQEETFALVAEGVGLTPKEVEKQFYEAVKIDADMVGWIKEVRESAKTVLVSNALSPFLPNIMRKHDLYPLFDHVFISSEIRLAKPDPRFFEYVLNEVGVKGEEVVMIDDNPNNIEAAEREGIRGIVYRKTHDFPHQLQQALLE